MRQEVSCLALLTTHLAAESMVDFEFQSHSDLTRRDTKETLMVSTGTLEGLVVESEGFEKVLMKYYSLMDNDEIE